MASPQLERIAESAVTRLIAPVACTLMLGVGTWGISTIVDRVSRIEQAVNAQHEAAQLMAQDVASTKLLTNQEGEQLRAQHDQILQLQFDVRMLEQARGGKP